MNIPIDYNKMQAELDKRHYMSQVYISNVETWKPTELGLKTYGKWCDLVGWENLHQEIGWSSTDDFMNLAIKRKWVERYYSFEEKQNVCSPTKFGHDLFRTFEYWIDLKAQKKAKQKETVQKIGKGVMYHMSVTFPKVIQGITQMMAGLSKGFEQLDYQDPAKKAKKSTTKKKKKSTKPKKQQQNDKGSYTGDQWQDWNKKWNEERKESKNNEWWKL